jgi:hypothetical protein
VHLSSWPSGGLFERVNANIKSQIEKIEDMTGDMDPKTNFALIVIQTELERYKFLVRSYLRARMAKVSIVTGTTLVRPISQSAHLISSRPTRPIHRSTNTPCTTSPAVS